jgi:transcriptional regulator with XRE-family HTH domain
VDRQVSGLCYHVRVQPIDPTDPLTHGVAASARMLATLARLIGDARRSIGWSQAEVAHRAGVSQATVSLVERNILPDLTFRTAGLLLDALGARVRFVGDLPPLGDRERQRDPAHARCVAHIRRHLERAGWHVRTEVESGDGRGRGWIDIIAFHPAERVLLVIEVKTQIDDVGGIERTLARYERGAWTAARSYGWRPRSELGCLLLLSTESVEAALRFNRDSIDQTYAIRAERLSELIANPKDPPPRGARGLALVDPGSRRQRWLRPARIDGRRSAAPYLDYADFIRSARGQVRTRP